MLKTIIVTRQLWSTVFGYGHLPLRSAELMTNMTKNGAFFRLPLLGDKSGPDAATSGLNVKFDPICRDMPWVTSTFNCFHLNGFEVHACEFTVQLSWVIWWSYVAHVCTWSWNLSQHLPVILMASHKVGFFLRVARIPERFCAVSARPRFFLVHCSHIFFCGLS